MSKITDKGERLVRVQSHESYVYLWQFPFYPGLGFIWNIFPLNFKAEVLLGCGQKSLCLGLRNYSRVFHPHSVLHTQVLGFHCHFYPCLRSCMTVSGDLLQTLSATHSGRWIDRLKSISLPCEQEDCGAHRVCRNEHDCPPGNTCPSSTLRNQQQEPIMDFLRHAVSPSTPKSSLMKLDLQDSEICSCIHVEKLPRSQKFWHCCLFLGRAASGQHRGPFVTHVSVPGFVVLIVFRPLP